MKKMIVKGINEKPLTLVCSSTIVCEPNSKCIIVDKTQNTVQVHLKKNAEVFYISIQKNGEKKACVGKNAKLHWIDVYNNSIESKTITSLTDMQAHVTVTAFFIGKPKEKYALSYETVHQGKNTSSDITAFGTVTGAHALTTAKTTIEKRALGAIAHQKLKTILMDDSATAFALPEMNIENHDVQATHNATVGHINKETLFYAMTRGLDEEHAKHEIVTGQMTALLFHFSEEIQKIIYDGLSKKTEGYYV